MPPSICLAGQPSHLGQCDVADVSQGRDHEPLFDAQVFKGVLKVDIADGDDDGVPVIAPVEATLLEPLEVCGVLDLLAHEVLCGLLLVHVHSDAGLQIGPLDAGQVCPQRDHDHLLQDGLRLLHVLAHHGLLCLGLRQGNLGSHQVRRSQGKFVPDQSSCDLTAKLMTNRQSSDNFSINLQSTSRGSLRADGRSGSAGLD